MESGGQVSRESEAQILACGVLDQKPKKQPVTTHQLGLGIWDDLKLPWGGHEKPLNLKPVSKTSRIMNTGSNTMQKHQKVTPTP